MRLRHSRPHRFVRRSTFRITLLAGPRFGPGDISLHEDYNTLKSPVSTNASADSYDIVNSITSLSKTCYVVIRTRLRERFSQVLLASELGFRAKFSRFFENLHRVIVPANGDSYTGPRGASSGTSLTGENSTS